MTGKAKCKILKEIRQQIANDNDIPYVVSTCPYQGECKGTCPKCEEELRQLEEALIKRKKLGKAIIISGAAALLLAGAGFVKEVVEDELEEIPTQGIVNDEYIAFSKSDDSDASNEPEIFIDEYNQL